MTEGVRSDQTLGLPNGAIRRALRDTVPAAPSGGRRAARRPAARVARQPVISRCAAAVVVAAVPPLCLQRVFAGPLPGLALAGEPVDTAWALLPLATVAPLAGLAVRRFRAWPVVLGGLVAAGLGDVLGMLGGGSAASVIAAVAHGTGAGLAVPATLALATEASGRRLLAAWWVAVTVAALAVLPGLDRYGAAASGSRATPVPWLTVAAIASVLLYAMLRERAGDARESRAPGSRTAGARAEDRAAFPSAERAQLAMLAVPAGALGLIALAVAYRPQHAAAAAAVAEAVGLFALAAVGVRGAANEGFAVACAALGFIVAPASGALGSLWALAHAGDHRGGGLIAAAAALGAVAGAFAARGAPGRARRHQAHRKGRASPGTSPGAVTGPLLAAAALTGLCLAGPLAAAPVLAVLTAFVAGGLAAAVAGRVPEVTTAGAMAGVAICLAGAGVGYLGEGAIQVQLTGTAARPAAIWPTAISSAAPTPMTALGWWELAGAAVMLGLAMIGCLRQARGKARDEARGEARNETRGATRSQPRGDRGAGKARSAHG